MAEKTPPWIYFDRLWHLCWMWWMWLWINLMNCSNTVFLHASSNLTWILPWSTGVALSAQKSEYFNFAFFIKLLSNAIKSLDGWGKNTYSLNGWIKATFQSLSLCVCGGTGKTHQLPTYHSARSLPCWCFHHCLGCASVVINKHGGAPPHTADHNKGRKKKINCIVAEPCSLSHSPRSRVKLACATLDENTHYQNVAFGLTGQSSRQG